ncbi:hypothetical protein HMPREF3091_21095 [Hafnia sp. HMSC23F03]|nr:hypothetical protein HMPREF3091_21095 [Hafnia sp. HMSC23F03]
MAINKFLFTILFSVIILFGAINKYELYFLRTHYFRYFAEYTRVFLDSEMYLDVFRVKLILN